MVAVRSTICEGKSWGGTKWVTAGSVGVIAMMRKAQNLGGPCTGRKVGR